MESEDNVVAKATESTAHPPSVSRTTDRSLRLYSKKHRVYILREFLWKTYGDYLKAGDVILDMAGGKGDLSWILYNVDDLVSVVVDPRRTVNHIDKSVAFLRAHPDECRIRAVPGVSTYQPIAALMPQLQAKNFALKTPPHLRIFVDEELVRAVESVLQYRQTKRKAHAVKESQLDDDSHVANGGNWLDYWERASKRTEGFVTPTGRNDFSIDAGESTEATISSADHALELLLSARLVVGFHPDQATDYCFQLATLLQIPVCVVPCCVFPSEFVHRRLVVYDDDDDDGEETTRAVERYDDLIAYLRQQHSNLQTAMLDFPGTTTARCQVLYTLPSKIGV